MNPPIKYYYEMTEYPKIFENVYWGVFKYDIIFSDLQIFTNRNNFVTDYNIKKDQKKLEGFRKVAFDMRRYFTDVYFDHMECYKTNDGKLILIVSIHLGSLTNSKMESLGFEHIYSLYSNCLLTWIKKFDSLEDVKLYYKTHKIVFLTIIKFNKTTNKWENIYQNEPMNIFEAKRLKKEYGRGGMVYISETPRLF